MTDPAGTPPLSGSGAAGQVTRIFASEVVCVGGAMYVIFALKTAFAGALVIGFPSFVKYIVSGAATLSPVAVQIRPVTRITRVGRIGASL